MVTSDKGSYVPGKLADPNSELDRLKRQAEMFNTLEADVLTRSGLQQHHRVLELGCGPGFVSKLLARLASDGELVSVDNNRELLSMYHAQVASPPRGGAIALEGSVHALPVQSEWADFVYGRFLFQHVPSAERGLREAYRVTAPGGRCCIVDSDDGLVMHYPQSEEIARFLAQAQRAQSAYGGDRFIGRKLVSMMRAAGFKRPQARIISLTSSEVPFQVLFGILFGFKSALLGKTEELGELYRQLADAVADGRFMLAAGIFAVVGER